MSDTSYPVFQHYGTNAQRLAFTPSPPSSGQPLYFWYETDTGNVYVYTTAWHLVTSSTPAVVQLSQIVTTASQATVDFTSISGAYNSLQFRYISQDTTSGTSASTVRIRLNNDSTSGNYTATYRIGTQAGSSFGSSQAASAGGVAIGPQPNAGNTGLASSGELLLHSYANTTFHKRVLGITAADWSGSDQSMLIQARWANTAAVTRVTFTTDGTAFTNGSIFTMYGIN